MQVPFKANSINMGYPPKRWLCYRKMEKLVSMGANLLNNSGKLDG